MGKNSTDVRPAESHGDSTRELRSARDDGASSDDALLEVQGLSYSHPGGQRVFRGLDLSVGRGEAVAIMGGSGAGKTTLAELVFGLRGLEEERGSIVMDRSQSALMLQEGALLEHLTVAENLALVLRRRGERSSRSELSRIIEEVGLGDEYLDRYPSELSGGQKRRAALARALCAGPRLLYCDEPSAGLDMDGVGEIGRLLRRLVEQGDRSAVVVTHDPKLAALVADRVFMLQDGVLTPVADWRDDAVRADAEDRARSLAADCRGRMSLQRVDAQGSKPGQHPVLAKWSPLAIGDYALSTWAALRALPRSLRFFRDFLNVFGRTMNLAGFSGIPFFALVGTILGATFIMILVSASILPVQVTLEKIQAVPLTAMSVPLAAFLYSARSGSAVSSWLGSMGHTRQVDALMSLEISPDEYLRAPVWTALVFSFVVAVAVFFASMWLGAYGICRYKLGIANPVPYLHPFVNRQISLHAMVKLPVYALLIASVTAHVGLLPKKSAEDVAHGTTHVIIISTALVVLVELLFAAFVMSRAG